MPASTPAGRKADSALVSLPAESRVLFASDMHLGEHDRRTAHWFCLALSARQNQFSHLILLGDLFEAWIGDDQQDATVNQLLALLAEIAKQSPVFVMRGNRDFLLNAPVPGDDQLTRFSDQLSLTILADPCRIELGAQRWLLAHGDALCTDDEAYQQFRAESRQPKWAQAFLSQSLSKRIELARQMRQQSDQEKSNKAENLTDVNQAAAQACLDEFGLTDLIHGHTHRPAHHYWTDHNTDYSRHVLPDWQATTGRGGFFMLDSNGLSELPPGPVPAS